MKKLTYLLVAMVVLSVTMLTGCGGKNEKLIRINEVTHSIFYAPLYVAMTKGYFEEENIEIKLTNGGGSNVSMTALISGSADVALVGPETAVYTAAEGKKDLPKVFGQLTKTDGSFLVGRNKEENFKWENLKGKEVIGGRQGGMPAMTLEYVVKQKGMTLGKGPDQVNVRYDISFDNMTGAFIGDAGDYVTIFEPTASLVEREGNGYIVASVGEAAGEVPFTAFVANSSYLEKNNEKMKGFLRAVMKGYDFIMESTIDEVIAALKPQFELFTDADIRSSVESYKRINAWTTTPVMNENAYNNLTNIIREAGKLTKEVPFSSIIDNSIAEAVIAERDAA